jgi:hypothetical protein
LAHKKSNDLLASIFYSLVDNKNEQKAKFNQKKNNILTGSKYASRTLRNEASFEEYDDEGYYSEEQQERNNRNSMVRMPQP